MVTEDDGSVYITPKEATKYFAMNPHVGCIRGWMTNGVPDRKSKDKNARIRLRCVHEGKLYYTTRAWIEDFKKRCQDNFLPRPKRR